MLSHYCHLRQTDKSNIVSLAAAWDKQVIEDVSQVLIAEAKSKGVDVLLGPTGECGSVICR